MNRQGMQCSTIFGDNTQLLYGVRSGIRYMCFTWAVRSLLIPWGLPSCRVVCGSSQVRSGPLRVAGQLLCGSAAGSACDLWGARSTDSQRVAPSARRQHSPWSRHPCSDNEFQVRQSTRLDPDAVYSIMEIVRRPSSDLGATGRAIARCSRSTRPRSISDDTATHYPSERERMNREERQRGRQGVAPICDGAPILSAAIDWGGKGAGLPWRAMTRFRFLDVAFLKKNEPTGP